MENWRNTLVEILRNNGGEAHLEEIYEKVKPLIEDLDSSWKASTRGSLERNSSSSDMWSGRHDIFHNADKGSGNWSLKINFFKNAILNLKTNFYFLTTGKFEHRDIDYEIYTWNTKRNNKIKEGDLFIYRIPQKSSPNKKFYFFGAGQIGSIFQPKKGDPQYSREGDICAKIVNPIHFDHPIYESALLPSDLGLSKDNWGHAFNEYGIDQITLEKFLFLLNKGTGKDFNFEFDDNQIQTKAHQKILNQDFSVPDIEAKTSASRGKWQRYFRNSIILPNYEFKCAITGIKTESLLTAAHIMRWADHKDKRLDPQNGICLSKLVDKCFEDKLIFIDDEYKLQIKEEVKNDKELYQQLKKFENIKINLPKNKDSRPKKIYLQKHREEAKNKK